MHDLTARSVEVSRPIELGVSVVFGAAHGIGQSVSTHLSGQSKLLLSIDRDPSFSLVQMADPDKGAHKLCADITEPQQIAASLSGLRTGCVDLVLFSAGIQDDSQPELTDRVNLQGTKNCYDAVTPFLKPGALLVFLSSDRITFEFPSASAYVRSKRAIADFANDLAQKRRDLKILTLLPGPVDTALFRRGKSAEMISEIEDGPGILTPFEFAEMLFKSVLPKANVYPSGAAVRMYKRTGVEWIASV